jgi:formate-dependent nitrite reductase membrane component NrfD
MNWEWPIIIYLWAAGVAGGAYYTAFLADHLTGGEYHGARRVATALGVPAVILGVMMLVVDLGHPFRAWHLFVRFRPISPMSLGAWLLLLWGAFSALLFLIWWTDSLPEKGSIRRLGKVVEVFQALKPVAGLLDWATFGLSILVMAYTGVLLSVTSQALWSSTILLPALFVVSAVSTGIAALNLAGALGVSQVQVSLMSKLCRGAAVVCQEELFLLSGLLILTTAAPFTAYAAASTTARLGGPAINLPTVHAVGNLITGALSLPFWVGVVLMGLVLPLGTDGVTCILRDVEHPSPRILILLSLLVLTGGFLLRAVIVLGGQM